jgi:hypothetical protein
MKIAKTGNRAAGTALRWLAPILLAALAACGKQEPAPDPLKAQRAQIQKAKNVQGVVERAADETRAKVDEAVTK